MAVIDYLGMQPCDGTAAVTVRTTHQPTRKCLYILCRCMHPMTARPTDRPLPTVRRIHPNPPTTHSTPPNPTQGTKNATSHNLHLAGVFVGNRQVLARAQLQLDQQAGMILKVRLGWTWGTVDVPMARPPHTTTPDHLHTHTQTKHPTKHKSTDCGALRGRRPLRAGGLLHPIKHTTNSKNEADRGWRCWFVGYSCALAASPR